MDDTKFKKEFYKRIEARNASLFWKAPSIEKMLNDIHKTRDTILWFTQHHKKPVTFDMFVRGKSCISKRNTASTEYQAIAEAWFKIMDLENIEVADAK